MTKTNHSKGTPSFFLLIIDFKFGGKIGSVIGMTMPLDDFLMYKKLVYKMCQIRRQWSGAH